MSDYLNRPVIATDASGAVVWRASSTPIGGMCQVSVDTGALSAQEHRFPGRWFQAETGYHQNWHRDYDPTTGRYLQADPLGLIDGASVYGYARQNPLRYTDPTGEAIFIPIFIGIGIGIAIDFGVDYLETECTCDDSDLPAIPNAYSALGGAYGATGPFVSKPRTGVSGGGRSGGRTSAFSSVFGSATSGSGRIARKFGRSASRFIPYAGAGIAVYDGYRLRHCFAEVFRE